LKFSLKNLGSSHHLFGMEILLTSHGLFLSQQHYVCELLISTNMQDAKPVSTPLSTSRDLAPTSDAPSYDIGNSVELLVVYNICISPVQMFLSQWINNHSTCKLPLKGTLGHGLHLSRTTNISLIAFCDSDWVGDTHDRKSTTAYLIYKGPMSSLGPLRSNLLLLSEYPTITTTTTELLWLWELLK